MKRNDKVQQVMPAPFAGTITHFSIDQETGAKLIHVQAEDGAGRFFKEEELELTEVANNEAPVDPQPE